MTDKEPITYHCLISTANRHFLLLPTGEDSWALPTVSQVSNEWFPYDVAAIGRLIREQYGLNAIVLRHLRDAKADQFCELETQIEGWTPPNGSQWVDRQALVELKLAVADQYELLNQWLVEQESGTVPELRPPWERPGWLTEVLDWIEEQLARLNYTATGPVEPVKMAWSSSAILWVATTAGPLYFKAVYGKPPNEVAMIQALAERYPNNLPRIVASDIERRWMLMTEFDGEILDAMPDEWWPGAARRFAEIQIECTAELNRWDDLNCPDRTNLTVPDLWRQMLADTTALTKPSNGLEQAEVDQLHAMTSRFQTMWARLDEYAIPPSIHLQDFRGNNIAVVGGHYLYFDWGDCVMAHPFLSVQRMLDFLTPPEGIKPWDGQMNHPDDGQRRHIRDAYLEPWTAYGSLSQLREAFMLSRYLNEVYQAVRWYLETAYLEPGCPWYNKVVGGYVWYLRRLLDLEDEFLRSH